jgi:hypothetical protein
MRSSNCHMPYTAHGLKELQDVLKLHRKIVWIDPITNQVAVKKSFSNSEQTQPTDAFSSDG